mgnify:CR=1 FL=1
MIQNGIAALYHALLYNVAEINLEIVSFLIQIEILFNVGLKNTIKCGMFSVQCFVRQQISAITLRLCIVE